MERHSDEAIQSALGRLKLAVFVVEAGNRLKPYNAKAASLAQAEHLRSDLMTALPSHPLVVFIRELLDAQAGTTRVIAFPSGRRYRVEASHRSEKGYGRLLMLLIQPVEELFRNADFLEGWAFTPREREVAQMMLRGDPPDRICERLGITAETLKTHTRKVLAKTDTRNRAEFVTKVLGMGGGEE